MQTSNFTMLSIALAICLPAQLVSGPIDASSTGIATEGLQSVSSESALTKERIAVYRAFIRTYASDVTEPLTSGTEQYRLNFRAPTVGTYVSRESHLSDLAPLRSLSRPLSSEVADRNNVRLVDPER